MVPVLIGVLAVVLLVSACSVSPGPTKDIDSTVSALQSYGLQIINRIRSKRGLPDLNLSSNEAAQVHAEDSLNSLQLLDRNSLGFTPEMSYNQLGGGGYVLGAAGISGYLTERDLASCMLGTTICDRVDVKQEIETYFNRQLSSTPSEDHPLILSPRWDSVSIGVAHHDFTFVIYVLYERTGVEFVELPLIVDGYLTFAVRPLTEVKVSRLDFYSFTLPSPDSQPEDQDMAAQQQPLFSIFNPPPPGVWFRLPNTGSRVADAWTFNGDTLAVTADISESIQEEGVYQMVVWADSDEVPLGQYHIFVDDRAAFTRGETSPPLSNIESQSIEELRRFALELINADREDHGVPAVRLGSNQSAQVHAEDALEHGYVGHWTTSGLKPYMIY